MKNTDFEIFTLGHSTHSIEKFGKILNSFSIKTLVDVRSLPGSKFVPHFNKEELSEWIKKYKIKYIHCPELGGKRKKIPHIDDSLVDGWQRTAFRNYAAYTLTKQFEEGLENLIKIAKRHRTCIMCAESLPWKCHRLILSNILSLHGFKVNHIMNENKIIAHEMGKYGAKPKMVKSKIIYPKEIEE